MVFTSQSLNEAKVLFKNRTDAGNKLAAGLSEYNGNSTVVMAIPNGGIPLGIQVATVLKCDLDIIICRKLSLPVNQEGGLGALADDGTTVINQDVVKTDGISAEQIEHEVNLVKQNIRERSLLYKKERIASRLTGKTAILVDDGLASGITMAVAVEAVRHRRPKQVIVAVPLASATGFNRVKQAADRVVTCAIANLHQFYLADFYQIWRDVSDQEVVHYLDQWRKRTQI